MFLFPSPFFKIGAVVGPGGAAPNNAPFIVTTANATLTNERVLTGTTNQLTITDNGAGSTVVLSLPQNIDTGATPTFGGLTLSGTSVNPILNVTQLGTGTAGTFVGDVRMIGRTAAGNGAIIGGSTSFEAIFDYEHTVTDFSASTLWSYLTFYGTVNPSVNMASTEVYAADMEANVPSTNTKTMSRLQGLYVQGAHGGSGTVTTIVGGEIYGWSDGTKTVTTIRGGEIAGFVNSGAPTVTTIRGLQLKSGHGGSGGSVTTDTTLYVRTPYSNVTPTTHYGIFMETQAVGSTSYAIFTNGGTLHWGAETESQGISAPSLSPAGMGRIYFDSTANRYKASQNGGAYSNIAVAADNLSVFAATTSAQLAGVISDETGSGALVFATSPTLVTPVLGAATATSVDFGGGALANYVPPTSFTPTVTLVGGAGNTVPQYVTNSARYMQIGKRVFVDILLSGDGGNEGAGTGQVNVALPVAASASEVGERSPVGYYVNGGTLTILGGVVSASASTIALFIGQGTTSLTGADQNNVTRTINLRFDYEA